jgi:hypothetical protein
MMTYRQIELHETGTFSRIISDLYGSKTISILPADEERMATAVGLSDVMEDVRFMISFFDRQRKRNRIIMAERFGRDIPEE